MNYAVSNSSASPRQPLPTSADAEADVALSAEAIFATDRSIPPDIEAIGQLPRTVSPFESVSMDPATRGQLNEGNVTPTALRVVYEDLRGHIERASDAAVDEAVRQRLGVSEREARALRERSATLERENEDLRNRLSAVEGRLDSFVVVFNEIVAGRSAPPSGSDPNYEGSRAYNSQSSPAVPGGYPPTPGPTTPTTYGRGATVQRAIANPDETPRRQLRFNDTPDHARSADAARAAQFDTRAPTPRETYIPWLGAFGTTDTRVHENERADAVRLPGNALGPVSHALAEHTTMLVAFSNVMSYRMYRLNDVREHLYVNESQSVHKLKRELEGLFPTLKPFSGRNPITLLGFLAQIRDGFSTLGVCEGVAVRALHFFLDGDARRFYDSQCTTGVITTDPTKRFSWPHVINALIKRYLQDDVLQEAYEKVTMITQSPNEDENQYADRLDTATRACNYVFTDRLLVHHYVRGLLPSTRAAVTERLRSLPERERNDLTVVRRLATAEGTTFRARTAAVASAAKPKVRFPMKPTLAISDHESRKFADYDESAYLRNERANEPSYHDGNLNIPTRDDDDVSLAAVHVAENLEAILFTNGPPPNDTKTANEKPDELEARLNRPCEDVPKLTSEQTQLAHSVIPNDYWTLSCWSCREDGHSTFTCPRLTPDQRIFFAYKYYLFHVKSNPRQAEYFRQRMAKRNQERPGERGNVTPRRYGTPPTILRNPNRDGGRPFDRRRGDFRNDRRDPRPWANERNGQRNGRSGVYVTTSADETPLEVETSHDDERASWAHDDDVSNGPAPGNDQAM